VSWNVFQENHGGLTLSDDPGDVGPEMARVVSPLAIAGETEGLAGIARAEDVDLTAPFGAVESRDVIPDREGCEAAIVLTGDEDALSVFVPFDGADGLVVVEGEMETEFDSGDAGAQAESSEGGCTHI
jgi:hypothetical protein